MNARFSVESLEKRQLLSAVPIAAKIKVAEVTDANGNPLNESRVTVRFTENITLESTSDFRMYGYSINTASKSGAAQQKTTINILSVTPGPDGNKLIFVTDRRVRKGAHLAIYTGGVHNTSDNTDIGDQNVQLPAGLNKERFTLACRAFAPTNLNYFDPALFPGAGALTTTPTEPSTNTVTTQLTNYLNAEVAAGTITSAQMTSALAVYNSSTVAAEIPAPNLRAALASLTGTVADSAIDQYTTGDNVTGKPFTVVDFSTEVSTSAIIAETKGNPTTKRLRTLFKTQYEGESFLTLAPFLAHEMVHQDFVGAGPDLQDGIDEEEFAVTVETMVWAQELLVSPTAAANHTSLSSHLNADLLAMLNSGDALFPRVGVLTAPILSGNALPKSSPTDGQGNYTSFDDFIRRDYAARGINDVGTPGNTYSQTVQNNIDATSTSGNFTFGTKQIDAFDANQQIITDKAAIQLAADLKLTITR